MIERLTTITELPVADIKIEARLRDVSPDGVETLKETITANGFVGRIVVRRKKDGDYVMDGAHRLTAMRELGEVMIPCDVIRCSDDEAWMFEIDGNLAGADMSTLDEAYFLARRREAVQRLRPELKRGGDPARWFKLNFSSLSKVIAEKRGVSERQVYKIMAAGAKLDPKDYRLLKEAPKAVTLSDLEALSKITEAPERYYVIEALSSGSAKKVSAARKAYRAERGEGPAPRNATDAEFSRLVDAWKRASKAARRRFLEDHGADVQAHLDEMGGSEE